MSLPLNWSQNLLQHNPPPPPPRPQTPRSLPCVLSPGWLLIGLSWFRHPVSNANTSRVSPTQHWVLCPPYLCPYHISSHLILALNTFFLSLSLPLSLSLCLSLSERRIPKELSSVMWEGSSIYQSQEELLESLLYVYSHSLLSVTA